MKVRRREVNIFNMSLLDILCGALGAFCFMMLALFPSYIEAQKRTSGEDAEERARRAEERADRAEARAQEAEQQVEQEKANQTLVAFSLHWSTSDDVDLWIAGPGDRWWGPKQARHRTGQFVNAIPDSVDGLKSPEGFWAWDTVNKGTVYRVYAELVERRGGQAQPVSVRIYAACRFFAPNGEKSMAMPEVGVIPLTTVGERVELGVLAFDAAGNLSKFVWNKPGVNAATPGQ
jgi:hypothetical protein